MFDLTKVVANLTPAKIQEKVNQGKKIATNVGTYFKNEGEKQAILDKYKGKGIQFVSTQDQEKLKALGVKPKAPEIKPIYSGTTFSAPTGKEFKSETAEAVPSMAPLIKTGLDIANPFLKKKVEVKDVFQSIDKGKKVLGEVSQKLADESAKEKSAVDIYKQTFLEKVNKSPENMFAPKYGGWDGIMQLDIDAKNDFRALPEAEKQKFYKQAADQELKAFEESQKQRKEQFANEYAKFQEQLADPGGVRSNVFFPDSVIRKYAATPEGERENIIKEALVDIPKGGVRGFLDGMSFGIIGQVAPKSIERQDVSFKENKDLQNFNKGFEQVVNVVGQFAGGVPTYGAVAGKVGQALNKIPKVGTFLAKHPVFTSYVVQNLGEEMVEGSIRKATGQQYGVADFGLGMLMGAGMEAVGRIVSKNPLFKSIKPKEAVAKFESSLKEAEIAKGSTLTNSEVKETLFDTQLGNNVFGRDLFAEARLTHKTMRDANFMGRGRMTELKSGIQGAPTVKQELIAPEVPKLPELKGGKEGIEGVDYPGKIPENERLPWESEEEFMSRVGQMSPVKAPLKPIDAVTGKEFLRKQADNIINDYVETALKPTMGKGVSQGGLMRDDYTGDVVGRFGRVSENLQWYRDFFAENKKAPTQKDLRNIAIKHLTEGEREFGMPPNEDFVKIVNELSEKGLSLPESKMKVPAEKQPSLLSKEKQAIKDLGKNRNDLNTFVTSDGVKADKIRKLNQEVARRQKFEQEVTQGKFEAATKEDLAKVRKSGGISQDVINAIDSVVSKITMPIGKGIVNIASKLPDSVKTAVNHVFRQRQNIDEAVFKLIENRRFAMNREMGGVSDMLEAFRGMTEADRKIAGEYIIGKKVDIKPEYKQALDAMRDEIDIEGLRQVQLGNLDAGVYFQNMGSYVRRLYQAHNIKDFEPLADRYNALKNALISERGLDGLEAEKVIGDIISGNTKDIPSAIKPSGVKTGGDFLKKRKLGDSRVDLAIREFLGEVKDPMYLVGRTLLELKKSRINAEYLKQLAKTESIVDGAVVSKMPASMRKDYVEVKGKDWGDMDGKFIRKDVKEYLSIEKKNFNKLTQFARDFNGFIKANLTSKNPAGTARNFLSNFSVSQSILGHNFLSIRGLGEMKEALKELKANGKFVQELKAYGQMGDTGLRKELGDELEKIIDDALSVGKDMSAGNQIKSAYKKLSRISDKLYEGGDNIFLIANYKKLRAKGSSPEQAIVQARRVTPDYGAVNPVVAGWRQNLTFGNPFMTWRFKVYPELAKNFFSNPVRTTVPITAPWLMGSAVIEMMTQAGQMTEAEKKVAYTKLFRDGKWTIPLRDDEGDLSDFDFGQYSPFADLYKGGQRPKEDFLLKSVPDQAYGYVKGSLPGIASFPVQAWLNLSNNYDPFTRRPIVKSEDFGGVVSDVFTYLSPQLVPYAGLPVKKIGQAVSKEEGIPQALLEATTGIKLKSEGVGKFEQIEQYRNPDYSLDDNVTKVRLGAKEAANLAENGDKEGANKMLDELYNKYPEYGDLIKDRVKAEKNKLEGKSKIQTDIRVEIKSLMDIAKRDKNVANKRLDMLYEKYPEYEEYIGKKVKESKAAK